MSFLNRPEFLFKRPGTGNCFNQPGSPFQRKSRPQAPHKKDAFAVGERVFFVQLSDLVKQPPPPDLPMVKTHPDDPRLPHKMVLR